MARGHSHSIPLEFSGTHFEVQNVVWERKRARGGGRARARARGRAREFERTFQVRWWFFWLQLIYADVFPTAVLMNGRWVHTFNYSTTGMWKSWVLELSSKDR